jgi:hypothetical protein
VALNTYGYVGGNPNSVADPSGLVPAAAGLLCLVPGVGWVSCATVATGAVVVGGTYILIKNYGPRIANATSQACEATYNDVRNWMRSEGAHSEDKDPSTPTGQRGSPISVKPGTNEPTTIDGRDYAGHGLDRMQGRGVPPSAVEDAIRNGSSSPGNRPGTTDHRRERRAGNHWR